MDALEILLTKHDADRGFWTAVELWVNGRPLKDLVEDFEGSMGFEPVGGYDWISLRWLAGGGTFGQPDGRVSREAMLLVCQCHEPGCSPLYARVEMRDSTVDWLDFRNPPQHERDYSDFHFTFDRRQYESALGKAFGHWGL